MVMFPQVPLHTAFPSDCIISKLLIWSDLHFRPPSFVELTWLVDQMTHKTLIQIYLELGLRQSTDEHLLSWIMKWGKSQPKHYYDCDS